MRHCIEADSAPRGVGGEGVEDLQFARDGISPLGLPWERLCLLVPLEKAKPFPKILFHWALFVCALWAAGPPLLDIVIYRTFSLYDYWLL